MGRVIIGGVDVGDSFGGGRDSGPKTTTKRDGAFSAAPKVDIRIEADSADVEFAASQDDGWHLSVEHDAKTTVEVDSGPSSLTVAVKTPAVRIGNSVFRGGVIVNGVSLGGAGARARLSVPARTRALYDAAIRTGSGDISIAGRGLFFAKASARTGSGDVDATMALSRAKALVLRTGSGDVDASLPLLDGCDASIETGSGDATVSLGRVGNAIVEVSTGSGDKHVDHPDLVKTDKGRWTTPAAAGDAYELSLSTGSGDAEVRLSRERVEDAAFMPYGAGSSIKASHDGAGDAPAAVVPADAATTTAAPTDTAAPAPDPEKTMDPALAGVLAGMDLSKLPETTLDSSAAGGVSLTLPSGWFSNSVFSDPTLVAMFDKKALDGVAAMVEMFKGAPEDEAVWAIDFVPFMSAMMATPPGEALPEFKLRLLFVLSDKESHSPADLRRQAASMGGAYSPLAVEGADWACEVRSTTDIDGKKVGLAMFSIGYEKGAALVAFLAQLDLFDIESFRSIVKTIRPII